MGVSDLTYVRELTQIMKESDMGRISVTRGTEHVMVESTQSNAAWHTPYSPVFSPTATNSATMVHHEPSEAKPEERTVVDTGKFGAAIEVKSPIVGVFYAASSPEAEPLIKIGDAVKKGDMLCVIEAMKFFNEIASEHDGKIIDICMKNGDVVEVGQVLFKMV